MSITEENSTQGQDIGTERPSPIISQTSKYRSRSSSRECRLGRDCEEEGSRADSASDEEYDELDEDVEARSMISLTSHTYSERDTSRSHTFTESFQRYTSLPSINALTTSSRSSSSHHKNFDSIPIINPPISDGTAIHTLPPLRSLPIHPFHHMDAPPAAQSSRREACALSDYQHHHHVHQLPRSRSPSPERPRRNSVMRLENILNTPSSDARTHIPRPYSAGDTRHTNYAGSSERVKTPPHREALAAQTHIAKEAPTRRLDFRIISGWNQGRASSIGETEIGDDGDSASVTSTEGLSTMDVDMDSTPPTYTSTSEFAPLSKSTLVSIHESRTKESSSQVTPSGKPKRKVKMHPCPECQKEFPRPSGLRTHMTIHTKEKPFSCAYPGCTRTFSVVSNAKRHMRSHGVGLQDPANNPDPSLSTHDPSSLYFSKKGKERAFVVDFDEPVVVDPSPPNFLRPGSAVNGEFRLKWPAKGVEITGDDGETSVDVNGLGTGPVVGSHRGSGKRTSSGSSRTGSQGGRGARISKGDGGSGTKPSC